MKIEVIKTHKITTEDKDILVLLDKYLTGLSEKSVVAVTSKIVAICEGRVVSHDKGVRQELIEQESEYYIAPDNHKYNLTTSITRNQLVMNGGVDESNVSEGYVLWPSDPQASANSVRRYLADRFSLKEVGVVITDGRTIPLRWGVMGASIASSGFHHLNNYIGTPDVFGRHFKSTKLNIEEGLAAAASLVMGEGAEQTPLAIITDIPFVQFTGRDPTPEELELLQISMEDDLYGPLLQNAPWKKGGRHDSKNN